MSFFGYKPAQTSIQQTSQPTSSQTTNGFAPNSSQSSNLAQTNTTVGTSLLGQSSSLSGSQKDKQVIPSKILPDASSNRILKDLLDSAKNLPKLKHGNIGSINLTLNELQKKSLELKKKETSTTGHTRAHYLLSGSGINAADFETDLNMLPTANIDEPVQGSSDSRQVQAVQGNLEVDNIDKFLVAKKDESILSAIEQSLTTASRDFDRFINQNVTIDWRVRKNVLKKKLGIPVNKSFSKEELAKSFTWNKSLPGKSRILTPLATTNKVPRSARQVSREKFEPNAKIVYSLNQSRLEGRPFPICLSFEELSKTSTDSKSKQMAEIWRILADLFDEKYTRTNPEQSYYEMSHKPIMDPSLKKKIVKNSKDSLEQQFFNYMDEIYTKEEKKPTEFQPATSINKVSFFISKVIVNNNDPKLMSRTLHYNGVPIWALLFYLMRCGLYSEAVELTKSNENAFIKFDKNFPIYMTNFYKSGCLSLPSDLQERIGSDYNQTFQFLNEDSNKFDPYKYAVYKIIGKCDLAKKSLPSALNLSIEDWLWFHLSLINEFSATSASGLLFENYSLESLQRKVISSGPKRFNASASNPIYTKTLIMLGLYEIAIQYVYEHINECDAVHLAIALCYYGLLKSTKTSSDDLVVVNPDEGFEVNFSRLLGSYTRTFKISDPKVAAQYLVLICMSKGGKNPDEEMVCHEALRELISVSREFGPLLGELDEETGDKTPGILEQQRALINLQDINQFYHQITERTARLCEEEGRLLDALRLYQLCQEYDTVVSLINKLLSEILSTRDLDKPLLDSGTYKSADGSIQPAETTENSLILLSKKIISVFGKNSYILEKVSEKEKQINKYLLPMVDIRDSFVHRDWKGTLEQIKALLLIPIVSNDAYIEIRNAADSLNGYDLNLVKVIPSLLTITMTCVSQIHYQLLTKKFAASGEELNEVKRLKSIAKNCMVYAGMIQYRMPRETYSLLVNLESQL